MLRAPSACPAHVCAEERSPLHAPHRSACLHIYDRDAAPRRVMLSGPETTSFCRCSSRYFEISDEMNYRTPPRSTRKTTFSQSEDRDMKWRRDCRKKDCRHQTKSHKGLHPRTGFLAGRWPKTVSPCRRPDTVSASAGDQAPYRIPPPPAASTIDAAAAAQPARLAEASSALLVLPIPSPRPPPKL